MHASVCMCEHVLQGHVNLCMQPLDSDCSLHSQRICSAGTARPCAPSALPAASAASATAVGGSGRAVAAASVRAPLLRQQQQRAGYCSAAKRDGGDRDSLACSAVRGWAAATRVLGPGRVGWNMARWRGQQLPTQPVWAPFWLWRRFWRQSLKPGSCCSRPVHGISLRSSMMHCKGAGMRFHNPNTPCLIMPCHRPYLTRMLRHTFQTPTLTTWFPPVADSHVVEPGQLRMEKSLLALLALRPSRPTPHSLELGSQQ